MWINMYGPWPSSSKEAQSWHIVNTWREREAQQSQAALDPQAAQAALTPGRSEKGDRIRDAERGPSRSAGPC